MQGGGVRGRDGDAVRGWRRSRLRASGYEASASYCYTRTFGRHRAGEVVQARRGRAHEASRGFNGATRAPSRAVPERTACMNGGARA